jgi:hypothetical protein
MTAGLGVEVVKELIAAGSEGADIDRHLLTGRHYLLTVQLIAFELRRGGTIFCPAGTTSSEGTN